MSSFTGLYVQRHSTGVIRDVQVIDAAGNENSLDPDLYQNSGIQPPIEQLPDVEKYRLNCVRPYRENKERTLKSTVSWATLAAIIVALIAATLSVLYDCYSVAPNSDQCGWSQALFPVTLGLFFVIVWPVCFSVGVVLWWWKGLNNA